MQQDLTVFWRNNTRASELFYDLLTRADQNAYDDDFLARLAAYREASGSNVHADIFAAQYLLAQGDPAGAAQCGERAFRHRSVNHAVWRVLARAYTALGRYADALVMQGYASHFYNVPISINLPPDALGKEALDRLSVAMGKASYAPIALGRMSYDPIHGLSERSDVFAGEFLPVSPHIAPPYYVGVYTEQELHGDKAWLLSAILRADGFAPYVGGDFTFDIIRGRRTHGRVHITPEAGETLVLPIVGILPKQQLHACTKTINDTAWLSPATPNFFRLDECTDFSSNHDFIVGTPIRIGHAAHRRRLVLNILVDALPWSLLRGCFAEEMPNTHRFFGRGLIFDRHFSMAEYTYPGLAAIETGMYPQHNQVFNDKIAVELQKDYITLSERMKDLGYATANLMGDGNGIYNGVTRGYDRLIVTPYRLHAYEGAERLQRLLDGLHDADHFVLLHCTDVHPWPSASFQVSSTTQARLPLAERMTGAEEDLTGPYLRPSAVNQEAVRQGMRSVDRALGTLFSYLERHYAPEDYLVTLYSDHGVPVFSAQHSLVNEAMTHAAWMMRGAGVPEDVISDELVSAVDIYPTLAALCGFPVGAHVDGVLPRVFGGPGRDIVYSNSLYPSKAYYLAARSDTHTLRLDVKDTVDMDGTVDMEQAVVTIYPRAHEGEDGYEVDSPALRAFFYPRVREFLRGITSNGEAFPLMPPGDAPTIRDSRSSDGQ